MPNSPPWKMGLDDGDDGIYRPVGDGCALASYKSRCGSGPLSPSTWDDVTGISEAAGDAFRDGLTEAIRDNLETRCLPWVSDYGGWKVINASIWDNDGVKPSVFTTCTPEMTAAKQDAIEAALVAGVVINDDNMSDCGLGAF